MNDTELLAAARKALADWRAADIEEMEARIGQPFFGRKDWIAREMEAHDKAVAARDRLVALLGFTDGPAECSNALVRSECAITAACPNQLAGEKR